MNTQGLAKLYATLTPRERVPLIMAADARGDEEERRRLVRSAPRQVWNLPDYHGVALAWGVVSWIFTAEQLSHAAHYFHAVWQLDRPAGEDADLWDLSAMVAAYVYAVNAEAWQQFCKEMQVDPTPLRDPVPGKLLLEVCDMNMPLFKPTPEELKAAFATHGQAEGEPATVEQMQEKWRRLFDWCVQQWS